MGVRLTTRNCVWCTWMGCESAVRLTIVQRSVVNCLMFSVIRADQGSGPNALPSCASEGPAGSMIESNSVMVRLRAMGLAFGSNPSGGGFNEVGRLLVSAAVSFTTSKAITWPVVPGSEAPTFEIVPPNGESGATLVRMSRVPTARPEKSTTTSNRSAGPRRRKLLLTGAPVLKPPSVPMMLNCTATGFSVLELANWTCSQRESEALSTRKRYLRGSTLSFGQVLPFTTMTLPKNSGFQ